MNVALPAIQTDLHASVSGLQWTIDAYTLVLASLLMLSGSTADRFGRRRIFQTGLALFTLGSLLCSLAPSLGWLIAFRCVQAVGGSMLNPVAMSIITNISPTRGTGPGDRRLGWGGRASHGARPGARRRLVDSVGWRSIFWINMPSASPRSCSPPCSCPSPARRAPARLDPVGQVLVIVVLAWPPSAIIEGPRPAGARRRSSAVRRRRRVALAALLLRAPARRAADRAAVLPQSRRSRGATLIAVCAFAALAGSCSSTRCTCRRSAAFGRLRPVCHAADGGDDADLRADLRPARRRPRAAAAAGGRRAPLCCAGAADPASTDARHVRLAARLLRCLRRRLRDGQRADHQYRGLRHAPLPGRRRRRGRLDQPPDR